MTAAESTATFQVLAAADGVEARIPFILKRSRWFFRLVCAFGCLFSFGADAAPAEIAVCDEFARQAITSETPSSNRTTQPSRAFCFSDGDTCAGGGSLSAQEVWEHSPKPGELKAELMEYSDRTARVSEIAMPGRGGILVHISRRIGTARCIRDTYLLRQANRYRSIHNTSLDQLSAEGNCGDVEVRLTQFDGEPLLLTAFYGTLTAYRFAPDFGLREVCAIRYRAPQIER